MNASPYSALTAAALLALVSDAPLALAQPAAEIQYLGLTNPNHQSTPATPVVPDPYRSAGGFSVLPWGRMTFSYYNQPIPASFIVDGSSVTSIFPAGAQAAGMPSGVVYKGGIAPPDNVTRMDSAGNYVLRVPLLNPASTATYWGPLDNLQPLAEATRIGPTASGWWLKRDAGNNIFVGTTPDPTAVRIAAGQRPEGMPLSATNIAVEGSQTIGLFDGGQVTIRISATIPGSGTKSYYCVSDASGYRVLYQITDLIADLGFYAAVGPTIARTCSVGGDGSVLCTGALSAVAGGPAKDAMWKTDILGHSSLLLMVGQQAPALPDGVLVAPFASIPASGSSIIDSNGDILAWFSLTGPGVTPSNDRALVRFDQSGPHLLLRSGDTIRFGSVDVAAPAFGGNVNTGVWTNIRGDVTLWTGPAQLAGFVATYNTRTGWVGLAAAHTPPIAGFSTVEEISQLAEVIVYDTSVPFSSSGYDMGLRRLDDDGWVYFTMYLSSGGGFATRARAILPPCPADFDADGTVDFFDYDLFVQCFEGLACPPGKTADFDLDGTVDFFDYDAFVTAFEAPC